MFYPQVPGEVQECYQSNAGKIPLYLAFFFYHAKIHATR